MNVGFFFFSAFVFHDTTLSPTVFFWSGCFVLIAWVLFIIYPLYILDHTSYVIKLKVFPWATGIYALVVFLIVMRFFGSWHLRTVCMFGPFAFLTGLIFGITYSLLTRAQKLIAVLAAKPVYRLPFFLLPLLIWLVAAWA